jgi:hypothetical protein
MLAGIALGYLTQRAWDAWQDHQLMSRMHFQSWYPQMSGKMPTTTASTTSAHPVCWMNGKPRYRHDHPCPLGETDGWGGPIHADPQAIGHAWYDCPHPQHREA